MSPRSFRLEPHPSSEGRVIGRLRWLYVSAFAVYVVSGLGVIGLLVIVGSRIQFYTAGQPDWIAMGAFSILGAISIQFVQNSVARIASALSSRLLAPRWITAEQAARFPGLADPWPECWLEATENKVSQDEESALASTSSLAER